MGTPNHNLGLSNLNGVTFDAGAIDQVTSSTFESTATNTGNDNLNSQNPNTDYFRVDTEIPATALYPNSYTLYNSPNGVRYGYSHDNTFGYQFAYVTGISPSQIPLAVNVLGFAYDALLVSVNGKTLGNGHANDRYLYVINLTYAYNPDGTSYTGTGKEQLTFPLTFTANSSALTTPPCFAEGTRILTARGEVAVEDLAEGDEVATASGGLRPVIWIGSRRVRPPSHPRPHELNPVLVRAGAFGEGLPAAALRLSPGHAVFVDGVLVPVGLLVNGATIVQEEVDEVRYFHVELDAHDVLLAEGLACESYLDDGNREAFANSPEHAALYGRLDPVSWDGACAPMVREGERLAALQAQLHAQAEALGWVKRAEPGLRLVAAVAGGDVEIAPLHLTGGRAWFQVPACSGLTLRSNAGRPCDLVPGHGDSRRLGVAVSELRLDGQPLDLADEALFPTGAYGLERYGDLAWRWTDGAARLALAPAAPALLEVALHMTALTWTRPASTYLKLISEA